LVFPTCFTVERQLGCLLLVALSQFIKMDFCVATLVRFLKFIFLSLLTALGIIRVCFFSLLNLAKERAGKLLIWFCVVCELSFKGSALANNAIMMGRKKLGSRHFVPNYSQAFMRPILRR
jgi:hypothetical protein